MNGGLRRYGPGAGVYDVVSMERPVYRAGRVRAIAGLRLGAGDRVLDVGCGTGLSLPALVAVVGTAGAVVGIDASGSMLAGARRRAQRHQWRQVRLVQGDAASLEDLAPGPFDAAVLAYSLAVIGPWRQVWRQVLRLVRPGGRVAVVDTDWPTGRGRVWVPLAALALWTGGVDRRRRVWEVVGRDTDDVTRSVLRHGHIQVAAGTVRADGGAGDGDA